MCLLDSLSFIFKLNSSNRLKYDKEDLKIAYDDVLKLLKKELANEKSDYKSILNNSLLFCNLLNGLYLALKSLFDVLNTEIINLVLSVSAGFTEETTKKIKRKSVNKLFESENIKKLKCKKNISRNSISQIEVEVDEDFVDNQSLDLDVQLSNDKIDFFNFNWLDEKDIFQRLDIVEKKFYETDASREISIGNDVLEDYVNSVKYSTGRRSNYDESEIVKSTPLREIVLREQSAYSVRSPLRSVNVESFENVEPELKSKSILHKLTQKKKTRRGSIDLIRFSNQEDRDKLWVQVDLNKYSSSNIQKKLKNDDIAFDVVRFCAVDKIYDMNDDEKILLQFAIIQDMRNSGGYLNRLPELPSIVSLDPNEENNEISDFLTNNYNSRFSIETARFGELDSSRRSVASSESFDLPIDSALSNKSKIMNNFLQPFDSSNNPTSNGNLNYMTPSRTSIQHEFSSNYDTDHYNADVPIDEQSQKLESIMYNIFRGMTKNTKIAFETLVPTDFNKQQAAITFRTLLKLASNDKVQLEQEDSFSEIFIFQPSQTLMNKTPKIFNEKLSIKAD